MSDKQGGKGTRQINDGFFGTTCMTLRCKMNLKPSTRTIKSCFQYESHGKLKKIVVRWGELKTKSHKNDVCEDDWKMINSYDNDAILN